MRLKLERLRNTQNPVGTLGTTGTANVSAESSVPSLFPLPHGAGTNAGVRPNVFPLFPAVPREWEHEIASIDAAVPAVPSKICDSAALVGDPAAWEEELHRWTLAHCAFRDRAWGGVAALHRDYVEWSHATGNIPPATLATFRAWVVWQGFTLTGPLVRGLALAADVRDLNKYRNTLVATVRTPD